MSLTTNRDKLIYYAAFVDGEGYLEFNKRPKKNQRGKIYDSHFIRIEVTNTDFDIIQGMKNFFKDGYIYNDKTRKTTNGNTCKPISRYVVQYWQAYKVLKKIVPFMQEKNKRAKALAIVDWYENHNKQAVNKLKIYKEENEK